MCFFIYFLIVLSFLFFETRRSKPCNFIARIYYAFFSLSEKNNQANFIRVPFSNLCTSSAESFSCLLLYLCCNVGVSVFISNTILAKLCYILLHITIDCNVKWFKTYFKMSSNIKITRICQHCRESFTARTTVTKYCSHGCASRAYKQRMRNQNVEKSVVETVREISISRTELQAKEFLTISEASQLLNVSRWTISRAIADERLKAARMGSRVIIRRIDINQLFT